MSIEIIKDEFKIEEGKGRTEDQVLVEAEIYLNTIRENLEEILWVEGRVEITNIMIIKDKILINGLVKYNIAYRSTEEESNIYSLDEIKDFNEEIYIKGIREDMLSSVEAGIEYTEYELGESKLDINTLINIRVEVKEIRKVETIKDIAGNPDLQFLKENIVYEEVYGYQESHAEISETIKVDDNKSSIDRVIKFDLTPIEMDSTVVNDRVIVAGLVNVNLIYQGEEDIYGLGEEIPFNHFLEMPGVLEGAKGQVNLGIAEASYAIREDEMGELRLVDVEVKVIVTGKVFGESRKDLIIDVYSIKENLFLEKEEISIPENIENISYEEKIDSNAGINALDILDIKGNHHIIDKRLEEEGIIIEGNLDISIYYIDRLGGDLARFTENYPYKSTIPYTRGDKSLDLAIRSKLLDIDYNLKRDNLQIESKIKHDILLKKERKIHSIKQIEETGELIDKSSKPSIIVYIAQKGDLLWDIAKRYNTTIDEILMSNDLDKDYVLNMGDKIIIEKNLDLSL